MNRNSIIRWVFAPMVMGTVLLVACSRKSGAPGSSSNPSQVASATGSTVDQKAEIWTCPMHPQIKKDGPGTCPICGMALVKANQAQEGTLEEHGNLPDGHAPFQLSAARSQMIGVRYGTVEKKLLFKSVEAAGRVAFDPELYTAQTEYIEALKQQFRVSESPIADVKHSATRMVESAKLRLKVLGLSDPQIAGLATSGSSGSNLLIPKSGETLWIYAEVYEMDLANVRPGLEAEISGGSLGGATIEGKVASVDRVINPATRTAKVRILIPNARSMLRPEAYVDVKIRAPLGEQIVVPFDAVLDTGKHAWIFVAKENGQFEPRSITVRLRADEELAIGSGVAEGERIVTSANFLIDSESRLKGALLAQTEQPGAQAPSCPKGQHWDVSMTMCMPDVGQ